MSLIARATWQTSSDRLELRAIGLVRRSKALGLKHTRYADLARIEERRRGERTTHIHVFTTQGGLVGVSGFAVAPVVVTNDRMLVALRHSASALVGSSQNVISPRYCSPPSSRSAIR